MAWAIHNYSTPAIQVDEAGTATHDGSTRLLLPAALFVADTQAEAEEWRRAGPPSRRGDEPAAVSEEVC